MNTLLTIRVNINGLSCYCNDLYIIMMIYILIYTEEVAWTSNYYPNNWCDINIVKKKMLVSINTLGFIYSNFYTLW